MEPSPLTDLARILIYTGLGILLLGVLLLLLGKLPAIGRLPGDIVWEKDNIRVYIPLGTMILVSIVLTILLNLLVRLFR